MTDTDVDYEKVGIAVMLIPENNVGADHLTLGFFGTTYEAVEENTLTFERLRDVAYWVRNTWSDRFNRLPDGIINGTAILNIGESKYAYVGLVDSKDVEQLRFYMLQKIIPKTEHGFLPHMTYHYTTGTPITGTRPNLEVRFKCIRVAYGQMLVDFNFEGT